jgi:hypothetical protein
MKNSLYWSFNLPLQMLPYGDDYRILNYMPHRGSIAFLNMSDVLGDQTKEEFCEQAALTLENLARLFRQLHQNKVNLIYYPDEGMNK